MPRKVDPALIKKGSGMANQNSIDANAFVDEVVEGQNHGLEAHTKDPKGAHPASAISTTTTQGLYDGDDVQSNLDELSGLIPLRPPTIGNFSNILAYSGITDWGHLKLHDAGFVQRGEVISPVPASPNNDFFVYPEFWWAPFVAGNVYDTPITATPNVRGNIFVPPGNDPQTDPTFNIDPAGTADPTYTGGGIGRSHQGGWSGAGFIGPGSVIETMRVMPSTGSAFTPIVASGAVYPSDRGVIALIHWPDQGGTGDFTAQPLLDRCPAAILLGHGINDSCDGDPGGIFSEGDPDIFTFPGRATGQLDLVEIHSGVNRITTAALPAGPLPSAGQVRLGTDPLAGPVVAGGIPILGGTTIATGGGNDNNYFRYRLPYMDNYSSVDGIEYTPVSEKPRFFDKPVVSVTPGTDLTQAGDYPDFPKDYWHFQVARYRHRFTFLENTPLPPDPQFQGNWIIMHFRREADFEAFVRDGVMPDDFFSPYDLWGAGLVTYVPEESTDNLIDSTTLAPDLATSLAYHTIRGAIIEDAHTAVTVAPTPTYTFTREVDELMFVSGVQYFLPNGSGSGTNFNINTLSVNASSLWRNSYRLGNSGSPTEVTPGLTHINPAILYLGAFTSDSNIINGLGVGYTGTAFYQRVDFGYEDLGSVSGPFDLTSAPGIFDTADIILLGGDVPISFAGDGTTATTTQCHFWQDARIRAFIRVPSDQEDASSYTTEFLFDNPGFDTILFHTTDQAPTFAGTGIYGNFTLGGFGNPPRAGLEVARKDVEEKFFDEVYRVSDPALVSLDPTYNGALLRGNLTGPGLPFPASPIELPVRFASESPFTFGFGSFLQLNYHLLNLAAPPIQPVQSEAQVCGLPDRDPPVTDGVANPCPFAGRLIYPVTDYTTAIRPSVGAGDTTVAQFNYSTIADAERVYIRVFDAAWSNDPVDEPNVIGQPFLTFRLDGLELADFGYTPGPGPGNANIGIEVKVPGMTTWMDLGRTDGSGPSKQDPLTDGAGCQIVNPGTTFNNRDAITGTVYAQVQINVGPATNVFANSGATPAPAGVAPIMVRVRMKSGTTLDFTQGGPTSTSDTPRGLVGITLLRTSNLAGPPAYGPPTPYPT